MTSLPRPTILALALCASALSACGTSAPARLADAGVGAPATAGAPAGAPQGLSGRWATQGAENSLSLNLSPVAGAPDAAAYPVSGWVDLEGQRSEVSGSVNRRGVVPTAKLDWKQRGFDYGLDCLGAAANTWNCDLTVTSPLSVTPEGVTSSQRATAVTLTQLP